MTSLVIFPSKKRVDVKTFFVDFNQELRDGDSISTVSVIVQVFDGVDPNPSAILDGAATINGTIIGQDVQQGIVGVVYSLLYTVVTVDGFTHVITARLAITPDAFPATGNKAPFYLTSRPYAIKFDDGLGISTVLESGGQLRLIMRSTDYLDKMDIGTTLLTGTLRNPFKSFNYLEKLDLSAILLSGQLRQLLLSYNYLDKIDISTVLRSGTLDQVLLTTNYLDKMDVSVTLLGGSLHV